MPRKRPICAFCGNRPTAAGACIDASLAIHFSAMAKFCEVCGQDLTGKRAHVRTCSAPCRLALSRRRRGGAATVTATARACAVCGSPIGGRRRYCGRICRQRAYRERVRGWRRMVP